MEPTTLADIWKEIATAAAPIAALLASWLIWRVRQLFAVVSGKVDRAGGAVQAQFDMAQEKIRDLETKYQERIQAVEAKAAERVRAIETKLTEATAALRQRTS